MRHWKLGFLALLAAAPSVIADGRPVLAGQELETCDAAAPEEIVERARRYLSSASSEEYQAANFMLLPERTQASRRGDCNGEADEYSLAFEYAPFRRLGADRPWVRVQVPTYVGFQVRGDSLVRSSSGQIVEPKISRDEAVGIAVRVGNAPAGAPVAEATIVRVGSDPGTGWKWTIDFGDCAVERVEIDAVSGAVLSGLSKYDPFEPMTIRRYPHVAPQERAARIRTRYHDLTTGMIPAGVKAVLGEPDEVQPLYEPKVKNAKQIGHTYWYVIRRMVESGSVIEKDEEVVRVSFDLDGKVTRVDYWGERPALENRS